MILIWSIEWIEGERPLARQRDSQRTDADVKTSFVLTAVHAKNVVVDDDAQGEIIKLLRMSASLPRRLHVIVVILVLHVTCAAHSVPHTRLVRPPLSCRRLARGASRYNALHHETNCT